MSEEKPRVDVSDKAKQSTTKCTKDFACLKGNRDFLCPVERYVGKKILFVKCLTQDYCSYQRDFGFTGHMCSCPVRQEIYEKYQM